MDRYTVLVAAASIGAIKDDRIPGLWHAPGHPELTTGQMMDLFGRMHADRQTTTKAGPQIGGVPDGCYRRRPR